MLDIHLHATSPRTAIPAAELRSLVPVASAAGIRLDEILRGLDLAPELLDEPRGSDIGLADYFRILERFSLALRDESCGLTARPLLVGATDLVLASLSGCRDLEAVMRAVARTYNILHGGPYNRVEVRFGRLTYVVDDATFPYASNADPERILFRLNCVLIFLHALLTLVAGDPVEGFLRQVHTKSDRGAGRGFSSFWGVPIRWGASVYALDYDQDAAAQSVDGSKPLPSSRAIYRRMIELAKDTLHAGSHSRSVLGTLHAAFADNEFSQSAVAQRAGMSIATLRRRLRNEGLPSFRELHDRALNEAARSLLKRRLSPFEVAEQLGFSDLRSFSRAFRRWNGMTPTAFTGKCPGG